MTRIRENAESIALYNGEPDEERRLGGAFQRIYDQFWQYMLLNKRLNWLSVFYGTGRRHLPARRRRRRAISAARSRWAC